MIGSAMSVYSAVTKNQANAGRATPGSTEATTTAEDPLFSTPSSPQDATRPSSMPPLGGGYGAAPTPTMPPPPFPFPQPVPPTA